MTPVYQLAFATSGQEALAKAARLMPDVILLDVMMPDMDGFEVCRQLRVAPLLAEVPILMITGLHDQTSRLAGIEAGADDFITKPFNKTELQARLKSITQLNRYRRLRVERARFARVIEQADDGYLIINDEDKILYINSKAKLFLYLPVDRDISNEQVFYALAHRQYNPHPSHAWVGWPNLTTAEPLYLIRPESPTSNVFWLQVDILDTPVGPDRGRVIRLRDVTEQMTLQRDMRGFHRLVAPKLHSPLFSVSFLGNS